ncbi:MAG: energy transducer TonB [Prolixibacteraceae bacterium]
MNSARQTTNRFALVVLLLLISTVVYSQKESFIYIGTNGKITTLENAFYKQRILAKSTARTTIQTFTLINSNWNKISTDQYKKLNDSTYQIRENGEDFTGTICRTFYQKADKTYLFKDKLKDVLVREGTAKSIVPLLLDGQVTEFYRNGNKKSISKYENNELISNENWNIDGEKYIDNLFYSVDTYPTYIPGKNVLNQELIKAFRDAGIDITSISGSLIIGFAVMEDGKIEGLKIIKGLGPNINNVAFNTFANMKGEWTPAKLNNKTVRYFQVFPINFIYRQYQFEFAEMRGSILHYGAY